jgi:hypothetical protein
LSFRSGAAAEESASRPKGTTHKWFVFVFFSRSTSVTLNNTHLPLGEICGSLTRFIAIRSAKVIGRLPEVAEALGAGAPPKLCLGGFACAPAIEPHPTQTTTAARPTARIRFIASV